MPADSQSSAVFPVMFSQGEDDEPGLPSVRLVDPIAGAAAASRRSLGKPKSIEWLARGREAAHTSRRNGILCHVRRLKNPNRIIGKPNKCARYSEVEVGGFELELLGNVEGAHGSLVSCKWSRCSGLNRDDREVKRF